MAWNFVQSGTGSASGTDTIVTASLTGVGAGHLIHAWVQWEGAAGATVASVSDGTSTFQIGGVNQCSLTNNLQACHCYLLVGNAGNKTYTVTLSAARPWKVMHVREYSYTGTASFDVDDVSAEGTITAIVTGPITTTGTDELVISAIAITGTDTFTSPLIGGSAASNPVGSGTGTFTYDRILAATMTAGTGNVTGTTGNDWVSSIIAFSASGGAGPLSVSVAEPVVGGSVF